MSISEPIRAGRLRGALRWRPGLRLSVVAAALAVVVGLAFFVSETVSTQLRLTATESALHNVEAIVRGYVDPTVHQASLLMDAPPDAGIAEQLQRITASGDIRRINIWTRDGRIVYSNEPSLRGQRFSIGPSVAAAFAGESVSNYVSQSGDGSQSMAAAEQLEIFVPIRGPVDGAPLGVYEVYQDARPIELRVAGTRDSVFLIAFAATSVLLALLWLAFAGVSQVLSRQNRLLRERAASEQLLMADVRRSEERFRSLVRNSSDCILVIRPDSTIAYESPAVAQVLGYSPEERLGQSAFEFVHPDDAASVARLFGDIARVADTQASAEFRARHADGSWRSLEAVGKNLIEDPAVRGVVVNYRDVTERRSLEEQLRHQAFHDALTGLPNRALFMDRLAHALTRTRGGELELAVVFLDLDDFKNVNDTLGHHAGDELLIQVADRLRSALRGSDTAARMGGDEFAILLEDSPGAFALTATERLLERLREPCLVSGQEVLIDGSAGIASSTSAGESADEMLRNADIAMYTAKTQGKGRSMVFRSSFHDAAIDRLQLKADLHRAIERSEFTLLYQPVVELATGVVRGVEALVRWQHPGRGEVQPGDFIPLAEETGVVVPMGRWVLEEACRQARAWDRTLPGRALTMSVNLSARQVEHQGLVHDVSRALAETGLDPARLILEITESVLMHDAETTMVTLRALKALGIRLAIDDFGTGYSSLSYLRRFPVDILKIDRSFVASLGDSGAESALVRSILALAETLELETTAEGIEQPGQLRRLLALGARFGQGFLFARPIDAAAIEAMLRKGPAAPTAAPGSPPAGSGSRRRRDAGTPAADVVHA